MGKDLKCYQNVTEIPAVDVAIIAISAIYTLETVSVLSQQKNTKGFIIFSAGFSEKDENGRLFRDSDLGMYSEKSIGEFEKQGKIYLTKNGKKRLIRYLDEENGEVLAMLQQKFYEKNCSFVICNLTKEVEKLLNYRPIRKFNYNNPIEVLNNKCVALMG